MNPNDVVKVNINNLTYDVSYWEFEYLEKIDEPDRLSALISLRYEHHVLSRGGTKKIDTIAKLQSRQAIRFAAEFLKLGLKK